MSTVANSSQEGVVGMIAGSRKVGIVDYCFTFLLAVLAVGAYSQFKQLMDVYELGILIIAVPFFAWLGWLWPPLRILMLTVGTAVALGIWSYQGDAARADTAFLLKYLVSSQTAILWMSALFYLALISYWLGLLTRQTLFPWLGGALSWGAVFFGLVGMLMRWYESYLLGPDVGHIPVSNLYEVMVLFVLVVGIFYLYYEQKYQAQALGGFVLIVVCVALGFVLWYSYARGAQQIQPLVPALQSWWMKLHVPANFIGYGTFSIAAMVGFAYIVKESAQKRALYVLPLFVVGVLIMAQPVLMRSVGESSLSVFWMVYLGIVTVILAAILAGRAHIAKLLPSLEVLDDIMYKSIAVGFAFFTVATVLGALWAADAWGAYWQWDPKETWALLVWLNYAAWLHLRLMKGLRGQFAAYWAMVGLLVTGFAFIGVNMFLSGLHSYGTL